MGYTTLFEQVKTVCACSNLRWWALWLHNSETCVHPVVKFWENNFALSKTGVRLPSTVFSARFPKFPLSTHTLFMSLLIAGQNLIISSVVWVYVWNPWFKTMLNYHLSHFHHWGDQYTDCYTNMLMKIVLLCVKAAALPYFLLPHQFSVVRGLCSPQIMQPSLALLQIAFS